MNNLTDTPENLLRVWRENHAMFAASTGPIPAANAALARAALNGARQMIDMLDATSDERAAISAEIEAVAVLLADRTQGAAS